MTILVQQQLREATERLIAESENCWPATVERFTELANPTAILALLDEIDRLNTLVIERETVRIGQGLQRHDDQKQIDELVALGIQQDKDEIARLKAENAELRAVGEQAWMALVGYLPAHQNEVTRAAIDRCMAVLGTKAKEQQP